VGDRVTLRKAELSFEVLVQQLSEQRGPATLAAMLYQESAESVSRREASREERRQMRAAAPAPAGRPNKRDRRRIVRFTGKGGAE
jgi:ribosome-associated heat shock protein Hsp15